MLKRGIRYGVPDLVPHRGAMSLLETIEGYGMDWLRASVTVRPGGRFATPTGIPGWVGIEYMAQAAAAFGGIEQVQRGAAPAIGLLIGARYYRCMVEYFPHRMRIEVSVKLALRDEQDFAAYDCTLESNGQRLAECTLKAYRPRDLAPLLAEAARG